MSDDSHIRERAHEIWEQAGRPDGKQEEHWAQASCETAAVAKQPYVGRQENDSGTYAVGRKDGSASPTINAPDEGGVSPGEAAAAVEALSEPSTGTGKEVQRR